jgi:6,7-dimethyl-8-ribityllumazine synthase
MRAGEARIAVIVSRFNEDVSSRLLEGALECFRFHGVREPNLMVVWCPGAFELPQAADSLLQGGDWDGVVCLGAVIRGETPHFEYVSSASAHGIQSTALKFGVPVSFGVLTTNTLEQAMDRSGGKHGNKGWDAADAIMSMVKMRQDLQGAPKRRTARRRHS